MGEHLDLVSADPNESNERNESRVALFWQQRVRDDSV